MLPCQSACPDYQHGCHKTCPRWADFQALQRSQRQAKKDYLRFYNELCTQVSRQLCGLAPRRPAR
ncbi:MAG TPA: hypothetical protein H9719_05825 [Candidatus Intestinimonas stercoravium]|uniref:hypothetical protein n=1 Tax=uncultured Intestinimonas sp. TaxID=1689265 RepID=UPI001F8733BF|nr:hypothetical protein [uncultured Intestinimonas sp.]HJA63639.1 hypothetical protein [Candidatus Intestinimonas stercoravium]